MSLLGACGDMDEGGASGGAYYQPSSSNNGAGSQSYEPWVGANQNDKYTAVGTNAFVLAASDPLSTFAADVDTASYDIFRRDVGFGQLPMADSVRLEEYVNYFDYDYPAPDPTDEDVPFSISLEAAPSPFGPGTELLRVGIRGRALDETEKPPTNLVFLVDVSGSMGASNKLPLAKLILLEALQVLAPEDTLSIVTYAGATGVALPATPVSSKALIADTIKSFGAGGSTAGAAGIDLAYQQAESVFIEGGINHVLLCTDGDFNVGTASDSALVSLIEEKRKSGITLTVLGFGMGNLNDSMMEKITNAGNGTYSVISDSDQAISYVHHDLLGAMTFIAKDMKLQVVFNPEQVHAYRLLGYENRAIADEDFTNDQVDAGEVGAGHTVTALYEVVLKGGTVPDILGVDAPAGDAPPFAGELVVEPQELVRVSVRWKHRTASEEDAAAETSAGLPLDQMADSVEAGSADLQWAIAVAAFAEILKGSPFADASNLPTIQSLIKANTQSDPDREEFEALMTAAIELLGQGS